jgi:predicted PurR-regulated permease PerM
VAGLVGRLRTAWFQRVEDRVFTGEMSFDVVEILFSTGMLAWTIAFVIFGVLIIRGPMPTWLGILLIICAFLPAIGAVPAWYYIGAIVLAITGLIRFRGVRST